MKYEYFGESTGIILFKRNSNECSVCQKWVDNRVWIDNQIEIGRNICLQF